MEKDAGGSHRGSGSTLLLVVILLGVGSRRLTRLLTVALTRTALSSPKTHENEPDGTSISADTVFVTGSILERMPFLSVSIHTLSALVAIPPSLLAGPRGRVATTRFVLMSAGDLVLSPLFGTKLLPNPEAKPEHGRLPTSMARTTLVVFVSRRFIVV